MCLELDQLNENGLGSTLHTRINVFKIYYESSTV